MTITAAGTLFYAKSTKRYLLVLRADGRHSNTWGLVGGKVEEGESVIFGLYREIFEEIGEPPIVRKTIPIEKFKSSSDSFEYYTFVSVVDKEFIPELNHEHKGYCWCDLSALPKPLHPGVYTTLNISDIQSKLSTVSEITSLSNEALILDHTN
jgi:8-oxo-dGTP pyrophosphatase MutT (NUDIX family)